jgi:lycopene cyclase domain-containing protein
MAGVAEGIGGGAYRSTSRALGASAQPVERTPGDRVPWEDGLVLDELQYLGLMIGCLIITLPLELAFGARVWRRPRRLMLTLLPALVLFVVWDVIAISRGHWRFAERYVTGIELPGDLPLEELAFFLVIPICGLLTLEAVRILLHDQPVDASMTEPADA